ncbi:MAG: GNAT family N-acetyltransferase, partial [Anaerolineaceae bacterium]
VRGPLYGQAAACEKILRSLPDWFGIESSICGYMEEVGQLPTFTASTASMEDEPVGFLALKLHNRYAAEVYVMGILTAWQRRGLGRAILSAAESWLLEQGVEYLQVKTLADTHPDPFYARTREFYLRMGFRPLENFEEKMWGSENPCLLMVKRIGG